MCSEPRCYKPRLNLLVNCIINIYIMRIRFSSVQSLSRVWLFATPWIAACLPVHHQLPESTEPMSIESVMPSSQLILCRPLLLLPPIPPSIRVFSDKSALRMRWPKYSNFTLSIIPSKEIPGLISLLSKGLSRVYSSTTIWRYQFSGTQFLWSNSHTYTWLLEKS